MTKKKFGTIQAKQIKTKIKGELPVYTKEGEEIITNVIDVEVDRDVNWFKVYMANLAGILDVIGNQKMTVFSHILDSVNRSNNMYMGTIHETIEDLKKKGTPVSYKTVADSFKLLQETGFWVKVRGGNYLINANIAMYGSNVKRGYLMTKFYEKQDENSEDIEE